MTVLDWLGRLDGWMGVWMFCLFSMSLTCLGVRGRGLSRSSGKALHIEQKHGMGWDGLNELTKEIAGMGCLSTVVLN